MQCACAILSSVTCPAVQYFSTLSHKRDDFRKNVFKNKMSFDFLYAFCVTHFSLGEELSEM
jgi:hypothetical protein